MDAKRRNNVLQPFKWREAEVITLLKLYKQYSCLWNNKIPEYRNRYIRDKAYIRIIQGLGLQAEALNITIADVRKKIKGLRVTYNDELRKITKSIQNGAKGDSVYQPSVFWFPLADSFLREIVGSTKDVIWNKAPRSDKEDPETEDLTHTLTNNKAQSDKEDIKTEQIFTNVSLPDYRDRSDDEGEYAATSDNDHHHQRHSVYPGCSYANDHQYFDIPEETSRAPKRKGSPEMSEKRKSKERKAEEDEYFEITEVTSRALKRASPEISIEKEKSKDRNTKEDEIDLFGKFVVMQLRKLPEMASLKVMQDFHKILIDTRMAYTSTRSNDDNYPSISAVYSVTGIKNKLTNMSTDIYNKDPLNSD